MAKRTYEDIAKEAIKNFRDMTGRMAAIANGNDNEYSGYWPSEEDLFPPLREFLSKNMDLTREIKEMNND